MTAAPIVSVLVMTHDHVDLVDEALAGVELQTCSFPVEVVLNDDFSQDGTIEKLRAFAESSTFPCRLLTSDVNLGANPATARGLRATRGTYVALIDGDDRWTDPTKLSRQVAVLDERPDIAISFHDVEVITADGTATGRRWNGDDQRVETDQGDLLDSCYAHTSSVMIRRSAIEDLPTSYDDFPVPLTDWPLHVIAAASGGLHYQPRVMSQYRHHPGGLYKGSALRRQVDMSAAAYLHLRDLVAPDQHQRLIDSHLGYLRYATDQALADGRTSDARHHAGALVRRAVVARKPRTVLAAMGQLARTLRRATS